MKTWEEIRDAWLSNRDEDVRKAIAMMPKRNLLAVIMEALVHNQDGILMGILYLCTNNRTK